MGTGALKGSALIALSLLLFALAYWLGFVGWSGHEYDYDTWDSYDVQYTSPKYAVVSGAIGLFSLVAGIRSFGDSNRRSGSVRRERIRDAKRIDGGAEKTLRRGQRTPERPVLRNATESRQACSGCGAALEEEWVACPACGADIGTRCSACGSRTDSNWVACPTCGVDIRRKCASCGKELSAGWVLCPFCGKGVAI